MNIAEYNAVVGSTAEEFAATDLEIGQLFPWQILKQNLMFELPVNSVPTLDDLGESPVKRMQGFLKTLQKEMEEGLEIMAVLCFREWMQRGASVDASAISGLLTKVGVTDEKAVARTTEMLTKFHESKDLVELDREALVMLADWLGDMTVFNRSEALKYGIPLENVLACIMGSNFTKRLEDGSILKDENGKFLKGPNFVAPERHIYATLFGTDELLEEYTTIQHQAHTLAAIAGPVLYNPMNTIFEAEAGEDESDEPIEEETDDEEGDVHEGSEMATRPLFG
jgi:hypothetical protein